MNKIFLVVSREYLTRVRKKSFVVMTILGPVMMALLYGIPIWSSTKTEEAKTVEIVDETGFFALQLEGNDKVKYVTSLDLEESKTRLALNEISAILHIPKREYTIPQNAFLLYSKDEPSMIVQSDISNSLQFILRDRIMLDVLQMSEGDVQLVKNASIKVSSQNITTGLSGFVEIKSGLGVILGIMIYFFIFMFGSQVMRGVMEEKTSRIVEVIVASIKPFQLMMGKIIGIALVGITQLLLWVFLGSFVIIIIQLMNPELFGAVSGSDISVAGSNIIEGLKAINFNIIIGAFLFFFVFGYLVYGSLFAAIGSLIENETDSNQFILPITILMIVSLLMLPTIINNPNGSVAFWMSIIPFTSPIVMMTRIPFGVQYWELGLSAFLLVLTFFASMWLAAKVYRTGILMYGKKITYREVWKWLKYKS